MPLTLLHQARACPFKSARELYWIANSVFAGAGVDEGNALGPPHHIPAHLLVPEVIVCTGGGLRALGVDKKLFVKWIFLKILSRGNVKFCPSLHFCNRVCSVS